MIRNAKWCSLLISCVLLLSVTILQAFSANTPSTGNLVMAAPGVVKLTPNLKAGQLAGRPDTDQIELSNGSRVRLGDIRRLKAVAAKIRAAKPGSKLPQAFRLKPAATGIHLATAQDLTAALKHDDKETVVLPSGKRTTVGMIRFLQPEIERRLGHPLAGSAGTRSLTGQVTKVNANSDWKSILQKPDGAVLEAPNGQKITVGELKQVLASSKPNQPLMPLKKQ